jgi:hypothetical protein
MTSPPLVCPSAVAAAGLACVALAAAGAPAQQYAQPLAPAASVRAPHCSLKGSRTMKANRYVRVFKVTKRRYGHAYGCRRGAPRAFELGIIGECQNNDEIRLVELAGRRAVLGIYECALTSSWWRVDLVDLRNGHREFTSNPITLLAPDDSTHDELGRIVVTADGAVAWTATRSSRGVPVTVEVRRRRRGTTNQAVLLDSGTGIDPDSLRRRGRTITWTKAGTRRSAQL